MKNNDDNYIFPDIFVIDVSRECNLRCVMCPHRFFKTSDVGIMDKNTFTEIINQISTYAKIIQLYWMGEPLLNPNIIDFIQLAKRKTKAKVVMSTNGLLLDNIMGDQIIKSGLDEIIIDIDATDEQTYSQIRRGGNFQLLQNNVHSFLSKNTSIEVTLLFLDTKINHSQAQKFIQEWGNYNCKCMIGWIDTWAGQMPELKKLGCSFSPYEFEPRLPCSDLWHKAVIDYQGNVRLCCHDYNSKYFFGNINQTLLKDIWNCKALNEIREQQTNGAFTGICSNCIEWAKVEEYEDI